MSENIADIGYCAIGIEATKGTAVTPDVKIPLYSETLATILNLDDDIPIMGNRFARYAIRQGQRDHTGEILVLAEPKTAPHFFNMLLTKGTTTNSGSVYTHPYTHGNTTNSYTLEFDKGGIIHRYMGVEVRSIVPVFEENVMKLRLEVSALKQFSIAPISSASGTTVTLATDYDPNPTDGVVAGDTIVLVDVSGGTSGDTEEVTISSVDSGTQLTVSSITGTYTTGDYCYVKAQSLSETLGAPFSWARTEFRFGTTAAVALTATHTALERGSEWRLYNRFEDDAGAKRSGSYDPISLVRTIGDVELSAKQFFDDAVELQKWLSVTKVACVIRSFGALISGTTYNEIRVTINSMKIKESPDPMTSNEIIYLNQVYGAQYDTSDAQGMDVKVINDVAATSYE